jgi:hypothetical protein
MDSRAFRQQRGRALAPNYAACLGHWWAAMRHRGLDRDLDQQVHLVLARCYPLVCQSKSLQDVYLDAHLAAFDDAESYSPPALPTDAQDAIRAAVAGRDRAGVTKFLDEVFERQAPPAREMPAFQEAFRHWAGNGVVALRKDDLDWRAEPGSHLARWLHQVEGELAKYRRRGGQPRVRRFANMFSYEAKVSFYTCYSNAWVDLIPWLQAHRDLDSVSERFLRLWSCQNQPVELHRGGTPGGLVDPSLPGISWRVPRPGPPALPDAFAGQVLGLHPLSTFVMHDPALLALIGRFLAAPEFGAVVATRRAEESAAYWGVVQAVLTAAALYRQQRQATEEGRGTRTCAGEATQSVRSSAEMLPEGRAFEEYAAARKLRCGCGSPLHYRGHQSSPGADDRVRVRYGCPACERTQTHTVTEEALREVLLP